MFCPQLSGVRVTSSFEGLSILAPVLQLTLFSLPLGSCLLSLPQSSILYTSGYINVAICWGVDEDNKALCPHDETDIAKFRYARIYC